MNVTKFVTTSRQLNKGKKQECKRKFRILKLKQKQKKLKTEGELSDKLNPVDDLN